MRAAQSSILAVLRRLKAGRVKRGGYEQMEDFESRLNSIEWRNYETAYGRAVTVPAQLRRLASSNKAKALDASHELWCGLCHQHAYVSSAALPALPFILEVLDTADDDLIFELLDILKGFAVCTTYPCALKLEEWQSQLRNALIAQLPRFQRLIKHSKQDVADFAEDLCECLLNEPAGPDGLAPTKPPIELQIDVPVAIDLPEVMQNYQGPLDEFLRTEHLGGISGFTTHTDGREPKSFGLSVWLFDYDTAISQLIKKLGELGAPPNTVIRQIQPIKQTIPMS